jgi:hypothetical protein
MAIILNDEERDALWHRARQRLELADIEPPVGRDEVERLFGLIGRRGADQSLADWVRPARADSTAAEPVTSAEIIPFDPRRQRFTPVAAFVRLAADSGGLDVPLPNRPLETDDGRFRLEVEKEGADLRIAIQALGDASSAFAGQIMGLSSVGDDQPLLAVFELDEDGDVTIRLDDRDDVRRALLRPMLGRIDEV